MGMNIGAAIFGLFCVFILGAGIFYTVGTMQQQPVYTDTYGNAYGNITNSSISHAENVTTVGGSTIGPLILIVGVVVLALVAFLLWIVAKTYFA